MNKLPGKRIASCLLLAGAAALAGCAGLASMSGSGPSATSSNPVYRCDQGLEFTVRFVNDTAVLKGARGDDVLLRDAGGQGMQTVYSNARLRAEFGLGQSGREAVLQYLQPSSKARCMRD